MSEETEKLSKRPKKWWSTISGKITAGVALLASIVTILLAIPVLISYFQQKPVEAVTELQRTPEMALEFWNGTKSEQYPMTSERTTKYGQDDVTIIHVTAKAAPFEIHFPTLKDESGAGMHICAWTDDTIFNITPGTNFKDRSKDNEAAFDSPFVPGKGISNTTAGNAVLPITNKYNSYWVGDRIEHISATKDKVFLSKGDDQPFASWKQKLYLAIWIDTDLNGIIGGGEYEYIVLDFAS
jgi:hypothetical protein